MSTLGGQCLKQVHVELLGTFSFKLLQLLQHLETIYLAFYTLGHCGKLERDDNHI